MPEQITKRFGPAVHFLDLWVIDYGVLREFYANLHRVVDGVWRSAQPAPRHLRSAARRGVRKVINLRGDEGNGGYWLERETCRELGLELVDLRLRSRSAPRREELAAVRDLIAAMDTPTLIHCKSGSDRTGLFSALYLIFREDVPVAQARHQLSWRFGHVYLAKAGVLDHLFEHYLEHNARSPIPFGAWLDEVYDPAEVAASFEALGLWQRVKRSLLRG